MFSNKIFIFIGSARLIFFIQVFERFCKPFRQGKTLYKETTSNLVDIYSIEYFVTTVFQFYPTTKKKKENMSKLFMYVVVPMFTKKGYVD